MSLNNKEKSIPRTNGRFFKTDLPVDSFTYPGWGEHAKKVEQTLTNAASASMSHTSKQAAQQMFKGMERFQQIHDGTLEHATIRKLQIAKFTYPRYQRDAQEATECYLRMEDTLAKGIVANIVKKQKLYNGDRPNSILALFGPASSSKGQPSKIFTYTYPMWRKHVKMIKDTLANTYNDLELSFGPSREEVAQKMFNGMKRLQRVYDKKAQHHHIMLLYTQEEMFTYPNWARDKEEAMILFLKFEDREAKEFCQMMKLKQGIYEGDRSHSVLVELDSSSFKYVGWQDHAKAVEMALTSLFKINLGEDRNTTAKKLLKGMRRLNLVLSGKHNHRGISELCKRSYSYPRWERDLEEAANHYLRFQDTYANDVFDVMKNKQLMHDGDRSEDVIVALDNMKSANTSNSENQESFSSDSPRDVMRIIGIDQVKKITTAAESARKTRRRIESQRGVKIKKTDELSKNKSDQRRGNLLTGDSDHSSARESMRMIEDRHGRNLKTKTKNNYNTKLGKRTETNTGKSLERYSKKTEEFRVDNPGLCTSAECSQECRICIAYKMNTGDVEGCLCEQISQFDQRSAKLLKRVSSEKL